MSSTTMKRTPFGGGGGDAAGPAALGSSSAARPPRAIITYCFPSRVGGAWDGRIFLLGTGELGGSAVEGGGGSGGGGAGGDTPTYPELGESFIGAVLQKNLHYLKVL